MSALLLVCGSLLAVPVRGEIVYEEQFNTTNGGYEPGGVGSWSWGEVTSGPGQAHSLPKAWGTGLIGDYSDNEDGVLISPGIDLRADAGTLHVLSWWQYLVTEFDFDIAGLEVSDDGGSTWQSATVGMSGIFSSRWTRQVVILNQRYAVTDFRLRFTFSSDESDTAPGFYVDDVTIEAISVERVYAETFDNDDGAFLASGTTDWEWGTPTSGPGAAFSPPSVWATNLDGAYSPNADAILTSPVLDLSGHANTSVLVAWQQSIDTEQDFDFASVEVSHDNAVTWGDVAGDVSGPASPMWMQQLVPLGDNSLTDTFRIRYLLRADSDTQRPGFYVDDIEVFVADIREPVLTTVSAPMIEDAAYTFNDTDFTAGFSDPDGRPLRYVRFVSLPEHGVLTIDAEQLVIGDEIEAGDIERLRYEPTANFNGTDSFDWNGTNVLYYSASPQAFNLIVSPVDDPPIANPDSARTSEDKVLAVVAPGVLANDTDADGSDTLSVTGWTAVSSRGAVVTITANGAFQYDPTASPELQAMTATDTLTDTFSYTVSDDSGTTADAVTTVDVQGRNGSPTDISLDNHLVNENETGAVVGQVSVSDEETMDSHLFTITDARFDVINDMLRLKADQVLDHESESSVRFSITATDNGSPALSITRTFVLVVDNVNERPTVVVNTIGISGGGTVVLDDRILLAIDHDNTANELAYTVETVSGGSFESTVTLQEIATFSQADINSGLVQFRHDGGAAPPAYTLRVTDEQLEHTDAARVFFNSGNNPPQLMNNQLTVFEGGSVIIGTENLAATDIEDINGTLMIVISNSVRGRFETVQNPGTPVTAFPLFQVSNNEIRFVHDGSDITAGYAVTVTDSQGRTAGPQPATITFNEVNDLPFAGDDDRIGCEDTAILISVLTNDSDADGALDPVSIVIFQPADHGTTAPDGNGAVLYTPAPDYHGVDNFRYTVTDDDGGVSAPALVSITVEPAADPPSAVNDSAVVLSGGSVAIAVLANDSDPDGDAIVLAGIGSPANGTATDNGDDAILYTSGASFIGQDQFTYTIRDSTGEQSTATVVVTVVDPTPQMRIRQLDHGWSLLAVSLRTVSDDIAVLLADAGIDTGWRWGGPDRQQWMRTETITTKEGVWVYCRTKVGCPIVINGFRDPITDQILDPGWHLVGVVNAGIAVPPNTSAWNWYNGAFRQVQNFTEMNGYWLHIPDGASQSVQLGGE